MPNVLANVTLVLFALRVANTSDAIKRRNLSQKAVDYGPKMRYRYVKFDMMIL
jgi:hypothetical protein